MKPGPSEDYVRLLRGEIEAEEYVRRLKAEVDARYSQPKPRMSGLTFKQRSALRWQGLMLLLFPVATSRSLGKAVAKELKVEDDHTSLPKSTTNLYGIRR